jgi:1-deoxy-D-xylulose-5-phosphate reductoisomerase
VLGSTGSIGTQALDVVRRLPGRFEIVGLAAHGNVDLLAEQAREFGAKAVSVGDPARQSQLQDRLASGGRNIEVLAGVEGMCALARRADVDLVVVSVAGAIGIAPTHAALENGKDIALASKEVLIAAGEITMELARAQGAAILPIDSEHSAIFQCLQGAPERSIEKILLTASGGPFRTVPKEALECVTPEQALKHPTWTMGGLVTINSATLMNKALETIEARWLFDVPMEQVEVVVHPQSIIHSMVRFNDGSTLAQLGLPDMRLPIQYSLVYPERVNTQLPRMELKDYANLTFEAPDEEKFPALGLARRAVQAGKTVPTVMNAANESAVALFLDRRVSYPDIMRLVGLAMERHEAQAASLENILEADRWARAFVSGAV